MRVNSTVIAYHAFGECPRDEQLHKLFVSPGAFESQMEYLSRRRSVVPLDAIVNHKIPAGPPAVAITFDDGYRSVLTLAAPILRRHGFPATLFVATRWIGVQNQWDLPSPCEVDIMTEDELRAAEALGIQVESHGHSHIDLPTLHHEQLQFDVATSASRLAEILDRKPQYFAYPYGTYSQAALTEVKEAGFEAAFSLERLDGGPFARERVQITPLDGPLLFALKTSGRYLAWRRSRLLSAAYLTVRPAFRPLLEARSSRR